MTWINENWIVVLLGLGFIAFHLLGHRGHGRRHGGHGHRPDPAPPLEPTSIPPGSVLLASGPDVVTDEYVCPLATDGHHH